MSVMRRGLASLVLLVALCGVQAAAEAQEKKPPAQPELSGAAAGLHVLVVDVQSLLQNSESAKMVRQQIEKKRTEYAKEISRDEQSLRRERDQLQRQQASLSPAALNQKGREFQQKVNDLDRSVQAKRESLERSNAQALEKIQAAILKIITNIAKKRKANIVFQRSQLVLFDQSFDVTDEVQQKLNEELPTLTVNFVTPATAAPEKHTASPPAHSKRRK